MKLIDINGQRFGRLLVLEKSETPRMWRCVCDCGNEVLVTGPNLRQHTKSCGCLKIDWAAEMGSNKTFIAKRAEAVTKHGAKRRGAATVEYKTWLAMKRRCYDTKFKDYPNWGGRGIRVCDRWLHDFPAFLEDMGLRPKGKYSIDRKNPNGNYEPENCRWVLDSVQGGENKRSNIPVVVDGVRFESVAQAHRNFGVSQGKAYMRIAAGIDPATAVTTVGRMKPRRDRESYLPKSKRTVD